MSAREALKRAVFAGILAAGLAAYGAQKTPVLREVYTGTVEEDLNFTGTITLDGEALSLAKSYTGTATPGVGYDTTYGYSVGSTWYETDVDKAYVCLDASAGAAVWIETTNQGAVTSVFGRTGAVTATAGDYTAENITNVPAGDIAAVTVQAALNELDTEKQTADAELTALAGLTSAANAIPYFTGSGTAGVISSSANMVSLLGSTDYAAARLELSLVPGTNVQAYDADLGAIAAVSGVRGDILYYGAAGWAALGVGTSGHYLQTQGAGADPVWSAAPSAPAEADTLATVTARGASTTTAITLGGASPLVLDGATPGTHATTLAVTDPTGANTITVPDASGTIALTSDIPATPNLENVTEVANATQQFTYAFTIPAEPENDPQHFQIQIASTADFAAPIIDWDSRDSGDGGDGQTGCEYFSGTVWEAWPDDEGVLYGYAGNTAAYTFTSASISRGVAYYVRLRMHDGTSWGDWTGDKRSW